MLTYEKPLQQETAQVKTPSSPAAQPKTTTKSLQDLAQAFCLDAQQDSIRYLIRSNTSHDGE